MTNDPRPHEDLLQEEFRTLYRRMQEAGVPPLAVAGGHGLLLKQLWLTGQGDTADIVVPLDRWRNRTPRATKDFDVVVDCALLADKGKQRTIVDVLTACDFEVTEENPRWQFEKELGGGRTIILELHAETPDETHGNLAHDRIRVKHKPSLDEDGVHGRHNPEAIGCHLHPFLVPDEDREIPVPNAITWAIMKLTAMADRHANSQKDGISDKDLRFHRDQAKKHASDVCRIVAMASRDEVDHASEIRESLLDEPAFLRAREIAREYFSSDDGPGMMMTEDQWERADHRQIRDLLEGWFA